MRPVLSGPLYRAWGGIFFGDYDNDGLEDIAVVHHHAPAALLRNETATNRTALVLKLVGRSSSRDAWNARVTATVRQESGGESQEFVRELTPGTSYLSANDYRARIGVAPTCKVDVRVQWPSGYVQTWYDLQPGGTKVLRERDTSVGLLP